MSEFIREIMGREARAEIAVYDGIMAEFSAEKLNRARKFERTHAVRNDGKAIRKDARKAYRKEKAYSCDPWRGWDTVAEFRRAEAMRTDALDREIWEESDKRMEEMRTRNEYETAYSAIIAKIPMPEYGNKYFIF